MIHLKKLDEAGINSAAGMERFMNDADLYEAVLNAFINENIADRAKKAFESGDAEQLLKVIHEAKGSSGNAGLEELYIASSELVKLLRSEDYTPETLSASYHKFCSVYEKLWNGIRSAME